MLFHKHFLVNAKVYNPMSSEEDAIDFLTTLVERINMKIIKGPFAHYVDAEGNEGLTAIVMIETSHIAFHIWDKGNPGQLQFDLYTCGELDTDVVKDTLGEFFHISFMDYMLIDRKNGFAIEDEGFYYA